MELTRAFRTKHAIGHGHVATYCVCLTTLPIQRVLLASATATWPCIVSAWLVLPRLRRLPQHHVCSSSVLNMMVIR